MTMTELLAQVIEEFRALGYKAIAYGPEFWLALCGLALAGVFVIFILLFVDPKLEDGEDDDKEG